MLNNSILEPVVINPKSHKPKASIIWLHGLGADGYDFVDIVPQLQLPDELAVRFVFPHAPIRPITLNGGITMRAWFDLATLDGNKFSEDIAGITNSSLLINNLIAQEIDEGINSESIILAGFSQGAAMALHCGLHFPQKLGGILALSGFLLFAAKITAEKNSVNQNIPILMCHGIYDEIVKINWAKEVWQKLFSANFSVTFKEYPMAHSVCAKEIDDISIWLRQVISY